MVEPSLKRGGIAVKKCSIPIHHYGKLNEEKNVNKGDDYYQMGKKKLDEMGGEDIEAIRELAVQAGTLGKHKECIELWERLIAIQPNTPEAFVNMSHVYIQLGKHSDALLSARKALELVPHLKEANLNYAISELYLGNVKQAIPVLEDVLERLPEYLSAQFMLAATYCCDGNKKKGIEGFEKLRRAAMGAAGLAIACHTLAKGLVSAERIEYATSLLETAIESKNVNKDVLTLFSECLDKMKGTVYTVSQSI
jgi:predicted Zn-dependent protease